MNLKMVLLISNGLRNLGFMAPMRPILEVEASHERKCSARFPTCDRVNVRAERARSNRLLPDRAPRREEVRLPAQQLQGR
jgi:hypothetical protein